MKAASRCRGYVEGPGGADEIWLPSRYFRIVRNSGTIYSAIGHCLALVGDGSIRRRKNACNAPAAVLSLTKPVPTALRAERRRASAFRCRISRPGRPLRNTTPYGQHAGRARGFGQVFGIHPLIASLTLIVDLMLFGGEVATMGAILPVSIGAGAVLGLIAYLGQRKWYGDDKDSAVIKALVLGFLTAIPTPLPAILSVPSGIVGLIHNLRRK